MSTVEFGTPDRFRSPASGPRRARILIVDDTPANLQAFSSILESPLYDIRVANSGEEALRSLLEEEFAVILLDVRMPRMDGLETARLIRMGRGRNTPIVFVSAHESTPVEVSRGFQVGAVDYLFSPVEPDLLKAKVYGFVDSYLRTSVTRQQSEELLRVNEVLKRRIRELEQRLALP